VSSKKLQVNELVTMTSSFQALNQPAISLERPGEGNRENERKNRETNRDVLCDNMSSPHHSTH